MISLDNHQIMVIIDLNFVHERFKIGGNQAQFSRIAGRMAKYAGGRDLALMQEIFRRLPAVACRKVKYVNFSREARAREVKGILSLFRKARVCQAVESTDASGVPLFAGADPDVWKPLFLDVGLANHACGVDWRMLEALDATRFVNEGAIAEQFVGQELLYAARFLPRFCERERRDVRP